MSDSLTKHVTDSRKDVMLDAAGSWAISHVMQPSRPLHEHQPLCLSSTFANWYVALFLNWSIAFFVKLICMFVSLFFCAYNVLYYMDSGLHPLGFSRWILREDEQAKRAAQTR
jgi:hypothetical protein